MKVESYQCDYCNGLYLADQMTGVVNTPDMFLKDCFTSVDASKAFAHFCFECYRIAVSIPVQNKMDWRDGEKYSLEREQLKRQLTKDFAGIFKKEVYRRFGGKTGVKKA
jgi:hypothetical protein